MRHTILLPIFATILIGAVPAAAQTAAPSPAEVAAIGEAAHKAYLDAINTNDLNAFMAVVTDDIVFQAPNTPEVVGRASVGEWVGGYLAAYTTHWDKTQRDFILSGDWAYQRYGYTSTDTDKATGAVTTDTGKGLIVYHRGTDGIWRVARDSWSSDLPAPVH
jgi:ketosteroid isomerase-like protein